MDSVLVLNNFLASIVILIFSLGTIFLVGFARNYETVGGRMD